MYVGVFKNLFNALSFMPHGIVICGNPIFYG